MAGAEIQGSAKAGEIDRTGFFLGLATYSMWGIFPIYFKSVGNVDPLQILLNRVVWSLAFILLLMLATRRLGSLKPALENRRVLALYSGAAIILAVNWYIYIWAVNHGHILEG
ncbi:MAG: EamA family transporter RarD, partial [Caldilineaceae bacterium]